MEEYNEQWLLGDIIEDDEDNRDWKIIKIGEGETVVHRDGSGFVSYDRHGDGWILLQFAEKSTKERRGKKWIVHPGKKTDLWIKRLSEVHRNKSELVRRESSHRESLRNQIATSIECNPNDTHFLEWESTEAEDEMLVNCLTAETFMDAISSFSNSSLSSSSSSSSSSVPNDGARNRDEPAEVCSHGMLPEISTLSFTLMNV